MVNFHITISVFIEVVINNEIPFEQEVGLINIFYSIFFSGTSSNKLTLCACYVECV